jgi:hypothetical protein
VVSVCIKFPINRGLDTKALRMAKHRFSIVIIVPLLPRRVVLKGVVLNRLHVDALDVSCYLQ